MEKPTRREICILSGAFGVVLFCWLSRLVDLSFIGGANVIRSNVYPLLFIYWAFTLKRRLIHPQVRRFTVSIAIGLVCWFCVRSYKFNLPDSCLDLKRYLWYLYYLPMLILPTLLLMTTFCIGLPEAKRLPKKTYLLFCIAAALFLLVMTNDFHQLVFSFPDNGMIWSDDDYKYMVGYYLIAAYMVLSVVATFAIMIFKCRRPKKRGFFVLPILPVFILLCYLMLYDLKMWWIHVFFGDMVAVFCVLTASSVELCIQCGLISSNTGYRDLFLVSHLNALITNQKGTVSLLGENAAEPTKEHLEEAVEHPVLLDDRTILKSKPIQFGHVFWKEDISQLTEAIETIKENLQELAERSRIQRKNMDAEKEIVSLREKNRTSDLLHKETALQLEFIDRLLTQYDEETDEIQRRKLLASAAVVGAYIKRYGNLLLVCENTDMIEMVDLTRCFEESFLNLELLDVECLCTLPADAALHSHDAMRIYSTFETILEDCLHCLKHVWVNGREKDNELLIFIEFVCDADLTCHAPKADEFGDESGAFRFTFRLQKGGAAV